MFRHRLPEPASSPATHSSTRNCAHAQWSLRHWFPEFRTRFHRKTRRSVGAWPRRSLRRFHLRSSPKKPTREIRLQSRQTSAKRRFITRCIPPVKPIQWLQQQPVPDRVKNRFSSPRNVSPAPGKLADDQDFPLWNCLIKAGDQFV